MSTVKSALAASSAVTCTLASLASDTNLLAGRTGAAVDNSTNAYMDYLLAGKVTTGTSPTTGKQIEVWVAGLLDDTTWPDTIGATDAACTLTSAAIKASGLRLAALLATDATSNRAYPFAPVSVASLFGGILPKKFTIYVVHNTGVALNATGSNHAVLITPVNFSIV